MPLETIEQDGVSWIELKQAAKHSKTKAGIICEAIEAGSIEATQLEGKTYIPLSAAKRLKREAATMAKVKKLNGQRKLPPARSLGVLVKDAQDVLPVSSGRAGRGWVGGKKD